MAEKIIVAVHGIGEQLRGETIRAVAARLCHYCEQPPSLPLGRFGAIQVQAEAANAARAAGAAPVFPGAFLVQSPPDPALPEPVGFGEVYWARIPRGPAADRYTLEESKRWAQTVVERVRVMERQQPGDALFSDRQYELARTVIGEMAEGIQVLQWLFFLADRAGLFRFDLGKILVDYLGDVQVVTEFSNYRRQILDSFHGVMEQIHEEHPEAEIYIVAHSEGSVIAFLALLEALGWKGQGGVALAAFPRQGYWFRQVRGFMTIGSPIGKHLLLWPELWDGLAAPAAGPPDLSIRWHNYYDSGDPVGFGLDAAKKWLREHRWRNVFDFGNDGGDYGFTRYSFPGKAHTDYWTDEEVFGHFFQKVGFRQHPLPPPPPPPDRKFDRPQTKPWAQFVSGVVPYLLSLMFLLLGVYLFSKGVAEWHHIEESAWDILRNVVGIGLVLACGTAVTRVPRLTRAVLPRLGAWAFFLVFLALFPVIISEGLRNRLVALLLLLPGISPKAGEEVARIPLVLLGVLTLAILVVVVVGYVSQRRPGWGVKPVVVVGSMVIIALAVLFPVSHPYKQYLTIKKTVAEREDLRGEELETKTTEAFKRLAVQAPEDRNAEAAVTQVVGPAKAKPEGAASAAKEASRGPVWPLLLAGAAFFYLWWLAALVFELAVIWHHYIKWEAALSALRQARARADAASGLNP